MPKSLHEQGTETVSRERDVQINDGSQAIERADKTSHWQGVNFSADGLPYVPSIKSYEGLRNHILAEFGHNVRKIEAEEEKKLGIVKANAKLYVTQNLQNLDLHLQEFKHRYLTEHPNGKGLREAMARELYDGLGRSYSGIDWIDKTNQVIFGAMKNIDPEVSNETVRQLGILTHNHLSNAYATEVKAGHDYRLQQFSNQYKLLETSIKGATTAADYLKFKSIFAGMAEGVRVDLGSKADNELQKREIEMQAKFVDVMVDKNPMGFLEDVKAGKYDGLLYPEIVKGGIAEAGDAIVKAKAREIRKQAKLANVAGSIASAAAAKEMVAKLYQDPLSVTDSEILRANLNVKDFTLVSKYKRKMIDEFNKKDAVDFSIAARENLGAGISAFNDSTQIAAVMDRCKFSGDEKNPIDLVDLVDTANSLGATAESQTLCAKLTGIMMQSQEPKEVYKIVQGYSKALVTNQPILGNLNKTNNLYAREMALASICSGCDFSESEQDVQQVFQLRNRLLDNRKDFSSDFKFSKEGNLQIEKMVDNKGKFADDEMQKLYNHEMDDFYSVFPRHNGWWRKKNLVPVDSVLSNPENAETDDPEALPDVANPRAFVKMVEAYDKHLKEKAPIYCKHFRDKVLGFKMAKEEFYTKCRPTSIYGGDEYMMYPPELFFPRSDIEGSSEQMNLKLRVACVAKKVQGLQNVTTPDNVKLRYVNPPTCKYYDDLNFEDMGEGVFGSNGIMMERKAVKDVEYYCPKIEVTHLDTNEKEVCRLIFEKTKRNDKTYAVSLFNPEKNTYTPILVNGAKYVVDFTSQELVAAVSAEYYKPKLVDSKYAEAKINAQLLNRAKKVLGEDTVINSELENEKSK